MTGYDFQQYLPLELTASRRSVEAYKRPLIPRWAEDLVEQVCVDQGRTDRPRVEWKTVTYPGFERVATEPTLWGEARTILRRVRRPRSASSGVTYPAFGRIVIRAGSDLFDARLVLLHELAHWLSPAGEGHGRRFWRKAWELYFRYTDSREGIERIRGREAAYKHLSVVVFRELDQSLWTVKHPGQAES